MKPLPAPVLSAVVVSPKEEKSSPKCFATLEQCHDESVDLLPPSDTYAQQKAHNGSIVEVITPDPGSDLEIQAILHADGTEFKTPQKQKPKKYFKNEKSPEYGQNSDYPENCDEIGVKLSDGQKPRPFFEEISNCPNQESDRFPSDFTPGKYWCINQ